MASRQYSGIQLKFTLRGMLQHAYQIKTFRRSTDDTFMAILWIHQKLKSVKAFSFRRRQQQLQ